MQSDTTSIPNRDLLREFLEGKLQEASSSQFTKMGYIPETNSQTLNNMRSELESLITSDPRFFGSTVKMVRTHNSCSGFYPKHMYSALLQRTFDTSSADAAIEWLEKVLTTKVADGKFITALWGVPVRDKVELTPEISLIPFDLLPSSEQKTTIENTQMGIIPSPLDWTLPSSALVVSHQIAPFLCDPEEPVDNSKFSDLQESVREIILLLTLIGPRAAIQIAHWFNFDDSDLELALVGKSRNSQQMEIIPNFTVENSFLDTEEAIEIIRKFMRLESITKDKIKIATDRLKRALLRHEPSDGAVEVSIALEILCGDKQTSEMTHKVKVRAVRLLGGDSNERNYNRTILTKTYDIRSKLVHQGHPATGSISVLGKNLHVNELIAAACRLCAELIKTIIRREKFPDWLHFDINDQI